MFSDQDTATRFMRKHELYPALALYLKELRQFSDAAEVYLNDLHDVQNAVETFWYDPKDARLVERGTQVLVKELWRRLSIGRKVKLHSEHSELAGLLQLASRGLSIGTSCKQTRHEVNNEQYA